MRHLKMPLFFLLLTVFFSCSKEKDDNSLGLEGDWLLMGESGQAVTNYGGKQYWANVDGSGGFSNKGSVTMGDGELTFNNVALVSAHIGYYQDVFNSVSMHTAFVPMNGKYSFTKVAQDSITIEGLTISSNFNGIVKSYAVSGAKVIDVTNTFNTQKFQLRFYAKEPIDTRLYTYFSPQINGAATQSSYVFLLTFGKG
jgi:hypothetical protein